MEVAVCRKVMSHIPCMQRHTMLFTCVCKVKQCNAHKCKITQCNSHTCKVTQRNSNTRTNSTLTCKVTIKLTYIQSHNVTHTSTVTRHDSQTLILNTQAKSLNHGTHSTMACDEEPSRKQTDSQMNLLNRVVNSTR